MKKILSATVIFIAVFLFSTVVYARDTATNISLDDRARFSVSLQSNKLVFNNEPIDKTYDSISLELIYNYRDTVRTTTYNRGQGNGATIDLTGLSDGAYRLFIGYANQGFMHYGSGYDFQIDVKGGNASFTAGRYYAENLNYTANERTDAYALDFYKHSTDGDSAAYIKQANIITAGITDDYAKVKAIHDWVANNMYYDYSDGTTPLTCSLAEANADLFPGSGVMRRGICCMFAGVTTNLYIAAGFPAKIISGDTSNDYGDGHSWTEVYVDNRWVFVDTTWDCENIFDETFSDKEMCKEDYFDTSMAEWSCTHELNYDSLDLDKTAGTDVTVLTTTQTNWTDYTSTKEISSSTKEFTIKFSKALNSSMVNSGNIYVATDAKGQNKVANVSIILGNSEKEIIVNSDNKSLWQEGKEYYLFITNKVQSLDGKSLKDSIRMKFVFK